MNEMVKGDARQVELVLDLLDYTPEQKAEVWDKQLIPNRIEDGERLVDREAALAYLQKLLDQFREDRKRK